MRRRSKDVAQAKTPDRSATIDALRSDVTLSSDDDDLAKELREEKLNRLRQANELRFAFFVAAIIMAGITIAASAAIVIRIVWGKHVDGTIAVSFISGLTVQIIGILAIVARYLFPRDGGKED